MNLFFFKKKGVIQLLKISFKHLVLCLRLHMISPKPKFPLHIIQLESGTSSLDNKNKKYSCYHKLHWKTIVSLKVNRSLTKIMFVGWNKRGEMYFYRLCLQKKWNTRRISNKLFFWGGTRGGHG